MYPGATTRSNRFAFLDTGELARLFHSGDTTPTEVVAETLSDLATFDRSSRGTYSTIALSTTWEESAEESTLRHREGRARSILEGIPVIVKDNIDTSSMPTTAGSSLLAHGPNPARDATLVRLLVESGAIVVAKASLSQWSNFRGIGSSSGWCSLSGQGRNPWDPARSPGGSSSGSGASVAGGFVPISVGTETSGSIICPAAFNGVFGLKPTVGAIDRAGIIPITFSQDTPGPMARSLDDLEALFNVLSGSHPSDDPTAREIEDGVRSLSYPARIRGRRPQDIVFGVSAESGMEYPPRIHSHFASLLAELVASGQRVVDPRRSDGVGAFRVDDDAQLTVLLHELADTLPRYLKGRNLPGRSSLCDLIAANEAASELELSFFGQEWFERANGLSLDAPAYIDAHARTVAAARRHLDAVFQEGDVDVLMELSMGPPWLIDSKFGDPDVSASYGTAAAAGYPSLNVPFTLVEGLPLGVVLTSGPGCEDALIRAGRIVARLASFSERPSFS